MCEVPVFYATSEGQTRRIAERIAARMRRHGLDSRAIAIVSDEAADFEWRAVRGAAVGASIHMQKHQREALAFARVHRLELSAVPSVFFSVSLAAVSKRPHEVEAARKIAERFATDTGWEPWRVVSVAGRLAYTQYNWLVRMLMRRIAKAEGASTDTSQDHEYTDWLALDGLADGLATRILSERRTKNEGRITEQRTAELRM